MENDIILNIINNSPEIACLLFVILLVIQTKRIERIEKRSEEKMLAIAEQVKTLIEKLYKLKGHDLNNIKGQIIMMYGNLKELQKEVNKLKDK